MSGYRVDLKWPDHSRNDAIDPFRKCRRLYWLTLVRKAKRRLDRFFPEIVRSNAFGFKPLHKRANRDSSGIRESIASENSVMHRIHEGAQHFHCFGRREATCPVKNMENMTDVAGWIRRPRLIVRTCMGTQAPPDRFMGITYSG